MTGLMCEGALIHKYPHKFCAATSLAEKEFLARQAAAKGLLAEDLERLRLSLNQG